MLNKSLTNGGWQKIFEELDISREIAKSGIFRISARQISAISKREPRLMTKFDSRESRPQVLLKPAITILPITNGEYVLLSGDGYFDVPPPQDTESYDASKIARLETIDWAQGIRTEPQAIDTLFMVSALRTFAGDDTLQLTIRGRYRSYPFDLRFKTDYGEKKVSINGVQIEVDSGYEGKKIVIVEAKFGTQSNFMVRQLYYPYRDLLARGVTKEIVPILLVYSNRIYSLYSFHFDDIDAYHSIHLTKTANYTLEDQDTPPSLAEFVTKGRKTPPLGIPFPQADDLSKVFDLCELLAASPADKEEIADWFQVDPRQGDYYGNAAAWLGLAEKSGGNFKLTRLGRDFNRLSRVKRLSRVADILSQLPGFAEEMASYAKGRPLESEEIARIISKTYGLTGTTAPRRTSTVKSWIDYLGKNLRS